MNNIYDNSLELVEEGIIRNIITYGPINTFRIWLEKWNAGGTVIDQFDNLHKYLNKIFEELDDLGVRFTEKYINKLEFENLLNDAIFNCIYNYEYKNETKASDPGKCIVEYFVNINLKILDQIFYETIVLLIDEGYDTDNIRNMQDFQKLELKPESKLNNLLILINKYFNAFIEFISSKQFNRYLTFSKIKKAIVDSDYRINKISELNTRIMKNSNINSRKLTKQINFTL